MLNGVAILRRDPPP